MRKLVCVFAVQIMSNLIVHFHSGQHLCILGSLLRSENSRLPIKLMCQGLSRSASSSAGQ